MPCWLAATPLAALPAPSVPAPPFRVGVEVPVNLPIVTSFENALRDLGLGYVNFYVTNAPGFDLPELEVTGSMSALCERAGLDFALACHHRNPSAETIAAAARSPRFQGVLVDEVEHIRLLFPQFAPIAREDLLADPSAFTAFEPAHDETVEGYRRLRERFTSQGAPRAIATHVWPSLLHAAARAGWTPCPKVCKEFYSPVSLAIGMGAALQYGRDLWVDVDMWYFALVPGHPVEEVEANLQMAYWLGADLVYLEGCGYNLHPAGRQGVPFSLFSQIDDQRYQLTPHGEMLKRFCRTYLPANPRAHTFRDVLPTVAIVRFDDTDVGQKSWGAPRLYGTERLAPDAETAAWFGIWNVLTHGATGRDGIAFFKASIRHPTTEAGAHARLAPSYLSDPASAEHRFFVPLNGAVVYDHTVGYERLRGVPLLYATGKALSSATVEALRRCVREGATCVAWGPLAARTGLARWEKGVKVVREGRGRWVLTDDFEAPAAVRPVKRFLGRPDEIRYRFGERVVTLRRVTDNQVRVEVTPASAAR